MSDPTTDTIRRHLTLLPDLCALLPDALITRTPGTKTRRPVPSSKPPVNLDIMLLDQRRRPDKTGRMTHCDPEGVGVLPYLDGWARDIEATALDQRPDMPAELPDPPTLTAVIEWLLAELDYAATLPQWYEMSWGIEQTYRAVKRAVGSVIEHETRPVPCNRCGEGKLEQVPGERPLWVCQLCGHEVSVQAVTLPQAAAILREESRHAAPTLRTLQRWAKRRGLLAPVSDGPRSRLFDLGQIRKLAAEARLREGA